MFAVAWGERAVELMARAARAPTRSSAGALDVTAADRAGGRSAERRGRGGERREGATDADGRWHCWISGTPHQRAGAARALRAAARPRPAGAAGARATRGSAPTPASSCAGRSSWWPSTASAQPRRSSATTSAGARSCTPAWAAERCSPNTSARSWSCCRAPPHPIGWRWRGGSSAAASPPGRTLFEGIRRIPPAHRVQLSAAAIAIEPYWRPRYEGLAAGLARGDRRAAARRGVRRGGARRRGSAPARGAAQRRPRLGLRGGGARGAEGARERGAGARRRSFPTTPTPTSAS